MKLTIYIVDDEPMAIRHLETLLKETSLELEVVGTAPNGVKAIPEIAKLHPDFVFVDISMPVMDGLQMSEAVLKQNPAQKIFMLTAYRDFEYAKKSVSIGVTDYILKNELSEQGLEELLRKNAADLNMERRRRHTIMETNLRNFFLSDAFCGMEEEWIYQDKPLQRYILLCIAPRPEIMLRYEERRRTGHVDCYEMENSITTEGVTCRAFIEIHQNEYCGIFFVQQDTGNAEQKCVKIAEDIMKRFGQDMPNHICIISTPVKRFSMLASTYHQLRNQMGLLYAGTEKIYLESKIEQPKERVETLNQDKWMKEWHQALEKGSREEAQELLETHMKLMRGCCDVWQYTEHVQEICRNIEALLKEKKYTPQILRMKEYYTDVSCLERDLKDSQDRYLIERKERREKRYSRHIILAQEYIQNQYSQDISVIDIAEAAGISEGHLRRCFKKEMNINVVNYLADYRLGRAKELMKNGRGNIDEIWKKTGFTSGQYFSYVFKKKEGITPREYMRMINDEGRSQERK